jgi:hypothetical protein
MSTTVRTKLLPLFVILAASSVAAIVNAQQANTDAMRWRYIGPVGNRTTSIVGVPGHPFIY